MSKPTCFELRIENHIAHLVFRSCNQSRGNKVGKWVVNNGREMTHCVGQVGETKFGR